MFKKNISESHHVLKVAERSNYRSMHISMTQRTCSKIVMEKYWSVSMKNWALGATVDTATYEHGCITICSDLWLQEARLSRHSSEPVRTKPARMMTFLQLSKEMPPINNWSAMSGSRNPSQFLSSPLYSCHIRHKFHATARDFGKP